MNIFEHCMKMELDGKTYYEEAVEKVESPELKRILMELASDELKHYNIFKALRDGEPAEYVESEKTKIFTNIKNIFQQLKDSGKEQKFADDAKGIWEHAREVEKQAEAFYREKAEEVDDAKNAEILNKIADEEHRHWVTMDNVIAFLDRPQTWLEDAEWNSLEDY